MCYRCTILDTHNVLLWLLGERYFLRSYVCLTMSKNCPHFRTFINTFTRGRHLSLSWSRSILSTPSLFSLLSILILSPHLGRRIEACHFRSCFLKKSLFYLLLNLRHTFITPGLSQPSGFDHPNHVWWLVRSVKLLNMQFPTVFC